MSKKTFTAEQIIVHLREVEVLCSQGKTVAEAARQIASQSKPTTAGENNSAG